MTNDDKALNLARLIEPEPTRSRFRLTFIEDTDVNKPKKPSKRRTRKIETRVHYKETLAKLFARLESLVGEHQQDLWEPPRLDDVELSIIYGYYDDAEIEAELTLKESDKGFKVRITDYEEKLALYERWAAKNPVAVKERKHQEDARKEHARQVAALEAQLRSLRAR